MRIQRSECIALCIDVQDRLFPHIDENSNLEVQCIKLLQGLGFLDVPVLLSEQYPKGLGPTILSIREILDAQQPLLKSCFSCADDDAIRQETERSGRKTLIVFGIEAHVCVMQTVIDFRARGYSVVVVADCIGSRSSSDKLIALERMRYEGAILATCESLLFELCRDTGTEVFKKLSGIIK